MNNYSAANGNYGESNKQRCPSHTSKRSAGAGNEEMAECEDSTEVAHAEGDQPEQGEEQRYILRWHRHAPTITDHLPSIYEKGLFADVTLAVDGESFKAHRLILASCSTYFLQIFQEADRNNIEHPFILLLNAHLEDVRAILNFIYKGECCVARNRIPELLATAKTLRVIGLCEMQLDDYLLLPLSPPQPTEQEAINLSQKAITFPFADSAVLPAIQQHQNQSKSHHNNTRDVPETCKCFVCGKYLSNQYNLRVHMETHDETYHACSSCPHVSRSRDALRKHMSYRHPDKYSARKHKRTHT